AGSLWTTYQIKNGFFKGLGFGGGPTYKSAVYVDIKNIMQVPGYVVADAVLFYKKEKWMAQINFRNITNTVYYTSPSFAGAMPGEPFNVVISAKASL
ncbi:MAG TPA: TonB-dependent receptor, partial [Turneriella sp.]|nr:TonB-dependent receptor [Turneriella sp.]